MPRLPLALLAIMIGFAPHAQSATVDIGYISLTPPEMPASLLDPPPADDGIQGARLALQDNQTTGRFLGQTFALHETVAADASAAVAAAKKLAADGARILVTDLPADALLQVAALPELKDGIVLDATNEDDRLRGPDCRANVLHLLPSRAMLADALMQFLAVKQWRNLLLVTGPAEADQLLGDAFRRSARKFQLRVTDKPWTFKPGAQRTDTGHMLIGAEVARFTQGLSYDVLVVADTTLDGFGEDLAYRTTDPRPVAGSYGLVPTAWAKPFEQWGGTQLQSRFLKLAHRWMTPHDYGAWMAVRAVGEASTRGGSTDAEMIAAYLRSPKFELAAFKGSRLTFRSWNGQLRQPVLLADARSLVSVSPQPGYLHQHSELDTLGIDQPETTCHM